MGKVPISQLVPRHMTPAEVVIDVFGGVRSVARVVDLAPSTVTRWRATGTVPSLYVHALLVAAGKAGKRLTLVELAVGRPGIGRRIVTFGPHKASPKPAAVGALGAMARSLTRENLP
jgi:hypothetical protein